MKVADLTHAMTNTPHTLTHTHTHTCTHAHTHTHTHTQVGYGDINASNTAERVGYVLLFVVGYPNLNKSFKKTAKQHRLRAALH